MNGSLAGQSQKSLALSGAERGSLGAAVSADTRERPDPPNERKLKIAARFGAGNPHPAATIGLD
jgi:hypothetical protein